MSRHCKISMKREVNLKYKLFTRDSSKKRDMRNKLLLNNLENKKIKQFLRKEY